MSDAPDIRPGKPLLVVDADEVLLQFLVGLEGYLARRDLYLDLKSYQLTGNIRRRTDDVALAQPEVSDLIRSFHASDGLDLAPVEGAAAALADLAGHAQIVVLTNIVPELASRRRANLRAHGLDYPVIGNSGPKGPAFAELAAQAAAPSVFVDDIPHHHASVAEAAPGAHQIHLVADKRLFGMARAAPEAGLFTSDWREAHAHILELIG